MQSVRWRGNLLVAILEIKSEVKTFLGTGFGGIEEL